MDKASLAGSAKGADDTATVEAALTADQYLTFQLAGQDYGVPILSVQEIKGWEQPTRLPYSPAYVQGVINLRGAVVPIVDLRKRFGMGDIEYSPTTVVIVVKINGPRGRVTAGIVVDAVCGVGNVTAKEMQAVPEMSAAIDSNFISGISTVEGKMLILLAIERLVSEALVEQSSADKVA
jgi:purine-binding chemotaxis protein CheW